MNKNMNQYTPDILGEGYQQLTLNFPDDYEGKVIATLVRKKQRYPLPKPFYTFMALSIIFFRPKWLNNLISTVMIFMRWI